MDMIKIAPLWKQTSKDGSRTYYSGPFGDAKILMFSNRKKSEDKQPDAYLFVAPKKKEENNTPDGGTRF